MHESRQNAFCSYTLCNVQEVSSHMKNTGLCRPGYPAPWREGLRCTLEKSTQNRETALTQIACTWTAATTPLQAPDSLSCSTLPGKATAGPAKRGRSSCKLVNPLGTLTLHPTELIIFTHMLRENITRSIAQPFGACGGRRPTSYPSRASSSPDKK